MRPRLIRFWHGLERRREPLHDRRRRDLRFGTMQRALKFRRRLVKAWVLLLLLLMAGFAVGIRNAYETRRMNQWVSHLLECYRGGVNSFAQKPIELTKFREALQQLGKYWLQVNHAPPDAAYSAV